MQRVFHGEQFVALALHHFRDGNAGGARHHFGNLIRADLRAQQLHTGLARFRRLSML